MKKIAIFQTDLNIGGIQKSLLNFLNNIDYTKYSIDLYLLSKENVYINDVPKDVKIKYLDKLPFITRIIPFSLLKLFYRNRIDEKYDITIDYNSYSMDTALAAITTSSNKKIIWVHNDINIKIKEEFKYRILYTFFRNKYKFFDSYVSVSLGALESFKERHNYNNKEYMVIPNLIDTKEIINKSKEECNINVDINKYNLCSVGRLVHQKGFDILLENYKSALKENKNLHLYIIGDGPLKEDIQEFINQQELQEYITLVGFLKNPYSLMNKMDGFVLTSRYEGQGIVFLEAKCLGLDIIMPKHLEKYVIDIFGFDNVSLELSKCVKGNKKYDSLESYNNDIIDKINKLLNDR